MSAARLPVFFLSHGGGPWPYVDGLKEQYAKTAEAFRRIPDSLPFRPKAILMITGHWEESGFTVSTAERPPMEYDYHGFPEHTYRIRYEAPGSPVLAARIGELLGHAGIVVAEDPLRGFDHGCFVPLGLMYPQADVPVVMLSLKSAYDPEEHIRAGQALEALRDEGVLIMGSGLTYHNMRGFGKAESMAVSEAFENYLNEAVCASTAAERIEKLRQWEAEPAARMAHPREDHLLPLMVAAGAAGEDHGRRLLVETAMNVVMASYRFGN